MVTARVNIISVITYEVTYRLSIGIVKYLHVTFAKKIKITFTHVSIANILQVVMDREKKYYFHKYSVKHYY